MKFEEPGAKAPSFYERVVSQGLKALLPRLKSGAPTASSHAQSQSTLRDKSGTSAVIKNSCGQYTEWLTDAALGSLAAGRQPELLAHAAECDACRDAYRHGREAHAFADAIDRGVESLVSGEPSPHFHARLRARIGAEAAAPRVAWRSWAPIVAMAAAFAIVIAAFVLRLHEPIPATLEFPSVALNRPTPSRPISPRALSPDESVDSRVPSHAGAPVNQPSRTPRASSSEPEVLVDPSELAAVIHFADAIRAGRVDGKKLVAAEHQVNAPLEIKRIEIAPLSTLDVDLTDARPDSSRP